MAQNDFMKFFDPDLARKMAGFSGFSFDINTFFESQQKNFQALGEAQQHAMEGIQAVAQRQSELLSQMAKDNTAIAQEIMSESTPEQKVAKQAELLKKNYEKSIANLKEIGEMLSKSNQDATDIINKRISASLTEVKTAIEKSGKTTTKKAA